MINKICEGCKNTFTTNRNKRRFCSKLCVHKYVKKRKPAVRICVICNKSFFSRRKTCSADCLKLLQEKKAISRAYTRRKKSESYIVEKVNQIIQLYKSGLKLKEIASKVNLHPQYIGCILYGKALPYIEREIFESRTTRLNNIPSLTQIQKEIIEGSLLGDACIEKAKYGNGRFEKEQQIASVEYIKWIFDMLQPYSKSFTSRIRKNELEERLGRKSAKNKKKFTESYTVRTVNHPVFKELRKKWYPEGIKIVPKDIELTPLSMAIWYYDDGSNHKNQKEIILHTQSFTENDINFLINKMHHLYGIKSKINYDGKKLPIIRIGADSCHDFINIVKSVIIFNCMDYKTTLNYYRDIKNEYVSNG